MVTGEATAGQATDHPAAGHGARVARKGVARGTRLPRAPRGHPGAGPLAPQTGRTFRDFM
jgi:hypothetical protein